VVDTAISRRHRIMDLSWNSVGNPRTSLVE
jgi:hypothetical protein